MTEPFHELDHGGHLRALVDGDVAFVLIGGLAVAALGAPRTTLDTDIVADPDRANLNRLSTVLRSLDAHLPGAPPAPDPTDPATLATGINARFETRLGQLHVVQSPAGAPEFRELWSDALLVELEPDLAIRVCSYAHLVAMKQALGRPQDLVDLEQLRQARGE